MNAEHRARISAAHLGKKLSLEHCAKLSAANLGKKNGPPSSKTRAKIAAAHLGKPHTPETRAKIRNAVPRGSNHPRWMGGISREPYGWGWNKELKEEVRRRDGYKCQLCGVPQIECIKKMSIHHTNYDKRDNDPLNLVALCPSCHSRTNTRREYWLLLFQKRMVERDTEEEGK